MSFGRRRIVTHAAALWTLVVLAAAGFAVAVAYLAAAAQQERRVSVPAGPGAAGMRLPTLVGTVTSVEGGGDLHVDSKQPFATIRLAADTSITSLGGARLDRGVILVGTSITATGHDLGDGVMLARAVVVLKEVGSAAPGLWSERLEEGESALVAWSTQPLLGWFQPPTPEAAFAVKVYDPAAKAASIEIYGLDGTIAERLELNLPGLARLKPGNPFLTPDEAREALLKKAYAFAPAKVGAKPPERGALEILAPSVGAAGRLGMAIRDGAGREVEAVALSDLAFRSRVEDPGLVRAWWAFSPEGDRIAAVYAYEAKNGTRPRSVHVIDLKVLGL